MRPHRPVSFLLVALAIASSVALPGRPAPVRAADATGTLEARVVSLGVPVAGVPVQVRSTGQPGGETWIEDAKAAVDTTDAKGIARFRGLAPGRYHVVGHCGRLPGDRIAGSIATKTEVLAGRTAHATLTLRQGGRILGRAMQGETGLSGVSLITESGQALPSSCPMLEPRNPGPDGRFTVGKVPLGTRVVVRAVRPLGRGEVEVTRDFTLAAPETVTGTWAFPVLDSADLGQLEIGVRLDAGQPADKGRMEIQSVAEGWRYKLGYDFTDADSLTTLPSLPPGEYTIRAMASPGGKTWWNASTDTILIAPGARRRKIIPGRARQAAAPPAHAHTEGDGHKH